MYDDNDHITKIEFGTEVLGVSLSKDSNYLLANISKEKPRIELWDLRTQECIKKYRGHD